jgi:hypothetical protein
MALHLPGISSLLISLFIFTAPARAVEYEVRGTVKHWWMKSAGTEVDRMEERSFTVSVRDRAWMIGLYPKDGINSTTGLWQTVASRDGETIIHARFNGEKSSDGWAIVMVESNFFPFGFNIPVPVHLWMVYASKSSLNGWNGTNLPPIYKYAYENYGNTFGRPKYMDQNVAILFHHQEPRLPTEIQFFNAGWSDEPRRTNPPPRRMRPPFENGYLNAAYEISDFRKSEELTLPWRFKFRKFSPNVNGKSRNDIHTGFQCEAQLISVTNKCSMNPEQADLPSRFVAMDHRLENEPDPVVCVDYNHVNFRTLPDIERLQEFSRKSRKAPQ